jgi:hypothetical protein
MPVDTNQRPPDGTVTYSGLEEAEHGTPAIATSTESPHVLDWQAFCAASFPGRRRHDLAAVIAYAAYRHSLDPARESTGSTTADDRRQEVSALRTWEDEGGG